MRKKGIFTLLTAVCMVLAFAAVSFAANQVVLKTTVPNIPKSTCYQAGTDTMEMDLGTVLREGDIIQFTLNNKVTVCKSLNMFLSLGTGTLFANTALPVSASNAANTLVFSVALAAGADFGFVVKATDSDTPAGQIITLTLRQRAADGSLVAINNARFATFTQNGGAPTDRLIVKLFDGKTEPTQWFKPDSNGNYIYNSLTAAPNAFVAADNALCIDTLTQDFPDEYVQNTPDSLVFNAGDKLSFSGDYRIAHILASQDYSLLTCKGANAGTILMGASTQNSGTCTSFDYETTAGYCASPNTNLHKASRFVLQASQPFEVTNYTVRMDILVNGLGGERGVYWSSTLPTYSDLATTGSNDGACASYSGKSFTGVTYLRGDGSTTASPLGPESSASCAYVTTGAKAITIKTDPQSLFVLNDLIFALDFPQFNYNLAEVSTGDVVSVRVTLSKSTCGVVKVIDIPIGTFGCIPPTPAQTSGTCILPFVPSLASGDTYWSGLAITNNSSAAGTVKLTAYKKDASTAATATVSIPSKGMVSGFVYDTATFNWTGTRPSGVPAYILLESSGFGGFDLNAFVFMADSIATADSDSMGYTCVKPSSNF